MPQTRSISLRLVCFVGLLMLSGLPARGQEGPVTYQGGVALAAARFSGRVADTGGNLAAGPDFDSSGVILIGGFRTGLFRSSDGGSTWQKVLADPSSVVPGINEVSVTFLYRDAAVATNPPSRYGAPDRSAASIDKP